MIPRTPPPDMPLFAAARTTDPATSKAAGAKAREFRGEHHTRILAALDVPRTIHELAAHCGLDHVAVARRMKELETAGKAEATAETRLSPSGSACRVWRRCGGGGV